MFARVPDQVERQRQANDEWKNKPDNVFQAACSQESTHDQVDQHYGGDFSSVADDEVVPECDEIPHISHG